MGHALKLHLQAVVGLLKHYGTVFRHVWSMRDQLDSPHRLPHEAQFLPAALSLQETPVSPAPRIAMWMLIAFAGVALLWAIFGHIDVVATAQGKLIPSERSKVIQPLEPATVRAIHVTDGQIVKAGDVLVELDATDALADQSRIGGDLASARLQAARARALLVALGSGRMPALEKFGDVAAARVSQEQRLLDGQFGEFQSKAGRIDAYIAQKEAEQRSTREIVNKLEQTLPIAKQKAQDYKDLVERNFMSKHGYLEREQSRIEMEADLATQKSRYAELEAAIREGKGQRAALVAETRRTALDSLNEAEQKLNTYRQEYVKADNRGRQAMLVAPVDGIVQQLAIHTVGGVVTEAQALMVVVPQEDSLEIEAFLENKDIGFVSSGQEAEIKVETFPYTRYGTIHGRVSHVSLDAISDEKKGLIYAVRIRPEKAVIDVEGKSIRLSPGMAVTTEIKTGTRRVIEYFLSPLIQYKQESLRER